MKNEVKDKGIFYPTGEVNQESDGYQVQDDMKVAVSYRFASDSSRRLIFQVFCFARKIPDYKSPRRSK